MSRATSEARSPYEPALAGVLAPSCSASQLYAGAALVALLGLAVGSTSRARVHTRSAAPSTAP